MIILKISVGKEGAGFIAITDIQNPRQIKVDAIHTEAQGRVFPSSEGLQN